MHAIIVIFALSLAVSVAPPAPPVADIPAPPAATIVTHTVAVPSVEATPGVVYWPDWATAIAAQSEAWEASMTASGVE